MIDTDTESWDILDWGVVDLRQLEEGREYPPTCAGQSGKGKPCSRPVAFQRKEHGEVKEGYCRGHAKKGVGGDAGAGAGAGAGAVPWTQADIAEAGRMKVVELREFAGRVFGAEEVAGLPKRKLELKNAVVERMSENAVFKVPKEKKCKTLSLDFIHEQIVEFFVRCPELLTADVILIENQPVKLNAVMKSVQMILWTTMRMTVENVRGRRFMFINADKKLTLPARFPRLFTDDALTAPEEISRRVRLNQAERKKQGIQLAAALIEGRGEFPAWFGGHKKKDDLADTLLMCLFWACDSGGLAKGVVDA